MSDTKLLEARPCAETMPQVLRAVDADLVRGTDLSHVGVDPLKMKDNPLPHFAFRVIIVDCEVDVIAFRNTERTCSAYCF